jgi:hypothetical protein
MMNMSDVAVVDTFTGEILGNCNFKDNKNKRNKDFVMLYRQFINQIADLGVRDPLALQVLLFLVKHMDNRNALAVTMSLIADITGLTRQTVSKKIKILEAEGWIAIGKIGKQNVYIVNPDVVWTSYQDDKSYCRFDAKVMLDPNDNWKLKSQDTAKVKHIEKDILKGLADEINGKTS